MNNGNLRRKGALLTVSIPPAGTYVNGIYTTTGNATTLSTWASVQPLSLYQAQFLPEAVRGIAHVRVYSEDRLPAADETTGKKGARFAFDGRTYEVQQYGSWDLSKTTTLPHYKAIAKMVEAS